MAPVHRPLWLCAALVIPLFALKAQPPAQKQANIRRSTLKQNSHKVLIIHSYHLEAPWTQTVKQGIDETFAMSDRS